MNGTRLPITTRRAALITPIRFRAIRCRCSRPSRKLKLWQFRLSCEQLRRQWKPIERCGAYPNSLSPFGSFDMGGDVFQWNEGIVSPFSRGVRGSFFASSSIYSAATHRDTGGIPTTELSDDGFRVASVGGVPEPVSIVLASLGVVGLLIFSKRLRVGDCSFAEHRGASDG